MFDWTNDQENAINTRGSVLVTAAAGSGKTAVLVERVVQMICDRDNPVTVDRLLIVTFTNAAAAEMRSRIEKRLAAELKNNPHDKHLKRQMLLLPSAQICTIDTFCINLVRENFASLSLSPDFKIVTDTELYPIYDEAMESVLDYYYENDSISLINLMNALGCAGDDGKLKSAVLKIFNFTCSMPFPHDWLEGIKKMYADPEKTANDLWLSAAGDCDEAEDMKSLEFIAPHATLLIDITEKFLDSVNALMREKNMLTFYNTEQMALSLLCSMENSEIKISDHANALSSGFYEILVDEYQDTNDLQDTLFYVLSQSGKKLFAVGDVKQSIYGFRGANPENFVNKKESYVPLSCATSEDKKKIVLSSNFRSRKEICGFVNYLFSLAMSKDVGGVEYNEEEILVPSGVFDDNGAPVTEIHLLDNDESGDGVAEAEAEHIAAYIRKTMNEPAFLRSKNGLRKATYGDFAILMRSPGSHAEAYVEALQKAGIPAKFERGGLLSSREVAAVLSFLKVICNPTQDIPLISVMMSVLFGFTAEDIAKIRLYDRSGSFYNAMLAAERNNDSSVADFLNVVRRFRRSALTMSVSRFMSYIYDETGLLDCVLSMNDGERRKNNLLTLLKYATEFESNGGDIYGFAAYIEKIGANVKSQMESGGNAVTVMSFHGSKGLQFPICIIADLYRRFNMTDSTASLVLDRKLGMSFKALDINSNTRTNNLARVAISKSIARRNISEELRVLYVALTRAEERLCIVLNSKNHTKKATAAAKLINTNKESELVSGASSYYDWFMYALLCHNGSDGLRKVFDIEINDNKILSPNDCRLNIYYGAPDRVDEKIGKTVSDSTISIDDILEKVNYSYPYKSLSTVAAKRSVSDIVHSQSKKSDFSEKPAFLSRAGLTPAQRGTATHKFMQFANYLAAETNLIGELERLTREEYITKADAEAIDIGDLSKFFKSELYARIKSADAKREMRFLTEIPVADFPSEKTVVQGVIDCVIDEGDSISVIDFKTDRVTDEAELCDRYGEQLNLYAKACQKMFSLPIKDKLIYSFALGKTIEVK